MQGNSWIMILWITACKKPKKQGGFISNGSVLDRGCCVCVCGFLLYSYSCHIDHVIFSVFLVVANLMRASYRTLSVKKIKSFFQIFSVECIPRMKASSNMYEYWYQVSVFPCHWKLLKYNFNYFELIINFIYI